MITYQIDLLIENFCNIHEALNSIYTLKKIVQVSFKLTSLEFKL